MSEERIGCYIVNVKGDRGMMYFNAPLPDELTFGPRTFVLDENLDDDGDPPTYYEKTKLAIPYLPEGVE